MINSMKQITYSFVIPHHNTPNLLQRLINSIPQREDIEIIVVDNNSDEDKKANIIRSDVRTIYIDKVQTKGAGHARNVGMDNASGKWLLFADSDDFYKPNFIEVLDEYKDDDIEILFFNIESVDSETLEPMEMRSRYLNQLIEDHENSKISSDAFLYMSWSPWRKMQQLSFIRKHSLRFEEIPVGNDVFFAFQTGYFVKKWKVDKRPIYIVSFNRYSLTYNPHHTTKYKTILYSLRKRAKFFAFIGHSDWNKCSTKGKNKNSVFRYIGKNLYRHPFHGIKILIFYLTHFVDIERESNHYVDVIKRIDQNQGSNR